jgi:hypothetical protein
MFLRRHEHKFQFRKFVSLGCKATKAIGRSKLRCRKTPRSINGRKFWERRARIWQIGCSEDERVALELNLQLSQTFSRPSSNTARLPTAALRLYFVRRKLYASATPLWRYLTQAKSLRANVTTNLIESAVFCLA